MKATYWQPGAKIDYSNGTDTKIEANTVVALGNRIGIVGTDIEPGALGSVITEGVFILEKTTKSEEIALGATVYFDGTGATATAGESTVPAGWAIKASSATDSDVYVKLGAVPASSAEAEADDNSDTP